MSQCDGKQRRDELLADTQHRVYRTVTSLGGTTINVENKLPNDKRKQNKTRNWKESTENNTMVNYSETRCNTPTSTPTLALSFFKCHRSSSSFRVLDKLGCQVAVRQRSEECDKDFDTDTSLGFICICFCLESRKRTTNTAVLTPCAAIIARLHGFVNVTSLCLSTLYRQIQHVIWHNRVRDGGEGNRERFIFYIFNCCFIVFVSPEF